MAPVEETFDQPETEIDALFRLFDQKQIGVVGIEELRAIFHSTKHYATNSELNAIIKEINKNGNDVITVQDFQEYAQMELERCPDDVIRNAFEVFDSDGDGYISKEDLRNLISNLLSPPTDEELNHLLDEADRKAEGRIDFEDFVNALSVGM
ncbi:neo-calmodulin-like [Clavelina lepadiformis]|uniref:EF-hand domain-containing protein n=1 Tax=Clavelina lepadiformis TaxID=159417 RepID=A0ABP0GKQ7_CLALP